VVYYPKVFKNHLFMQTEKMQTKQEARRKALDAVKDDWGAYMALIQRHHQEDRMTDFVTIHAQDMGISPEEFRTLSKDMQEAIVSFYDDYKYLRDKLEEIEEWLQCRPY